MLDRRTHLVRACVASLLLVVSAPAGGTLEAQGALVLQSDFGTRDGAVASMKGVAIGVAPALRIFDLTHEIAAFDVWEAAYRLRQVASFWPRGTVFVSIVDPGVGTSRLAVVARLRGDRYVVTPDNGTLTLVAADVEEVREIDVTRQRLPGSERSHTFHGRDVFAYVGARLATGQLRFDDVGPARGTAMVRLETTPPRREGESITGMLAMIDRPFGNLWTNIPAAMLDSAGWTVGDTLSVLVSHAGNTRAFTTRAPLVASFGAVEVGQAVTYLNSLLELAVALNQGSYAERFDVGAGPGWAVTVTRVGRSTRRQ